MIRHEHAGKSNKARLPLQARRLFPSFSHHTNTPRRRAAPANAPQPQRRTADDLPAVGLDQLRVEPTSATGRRAQTHAAVQSDGPRPVAQPAKQAPHVAARAPQATAAGDWLHPKTVASKKQMAGRDDERVIEARASSGLRDTPRERPARMVRVFPGAPNARGSSLGWS